MSGNRDQKRFLTPFTPLEDPQGKVIDTEYIDDWDTYHTGLGEVHCGTNAKKTLPADKKWWDE